MSVTPQPDSASKAFAFVLLGLACYLFFAGIAREFRHEPPAAPVRPQHVQQPHRSESPPHMGSSPL